MRAAGKELVSNRKKSFPDAFALLFFGEDSGLAKELARRAVLQHCPDIADPFALALLNSVELESNPSRLFDEAMTLSAKTRVLWIDAMGAQAIDGLDQLLADPSPSSRIVIQAGALRSDSPLRRFCETARNAVAISCEPSSSLTDLKDELSASGVDIDDERLKTLARLLPTDFVGRRNEIEKLSEFTSGGGELTDSDMEELLADASEIVGNKIIDIAVGGDAKTFARSWRRSEEIGPEGGVLASIGLRTLFFRTPGDGFGGSPEVHSAVGVQNARLLFSAVRTGRQDNRISSMVACRAFWTLAARSRKRGR